MRQAKFCLQGVTLFSKAISRLILKQVMGCLTRNRAHSNQFGFVQYNFDSRGPNYTVCLLRNRMKSYKFHQMVMEGFGLLVGARVQQHTMQSFCFSCISHLQKWLINFLCYASTFITHYLLIEKNF